MWCWWRWRWWRWWCCCCCYFRVSFFPSIVIINSVLTISRDAFFKIRRFFFTLLIFAVRPLIQGTFHVVVLCSQTIKHTEKKAINAERNVENGASLVLVLESRATQYFFPFCLLVLTHLVNIYNRNARLSSFCLVLLHFIFRICFASLSALFYFNFFSASQFYGWILLALMNRTQSKFFSTNELTPSKSMPSHLTRVFVVVCRRAEVAQSERWTRIYRYESTFLTNG